MAAKKLKRNYNLLDRDMSCFLRVVALRGSDGDGGHAVTVVTTNDNDAEDGVFHWIFDATFQRALPLCKDSLDKIVSPATCVGIMMGYSYRKMTGKDDKQSIH